jgi:ornithine cyclodeaminase/alanine dehydrogenase-like protein (mu-crystallin family)
MAIPFFDADAVRGAVPITELLDAVEGAYRDVATGRDRSPMRSRVALDDGDLLVMPGVRTGGTGATVKLVTVMPANVDRGLPLIHAVVAWFDAATGRPLALIDGATLTAMRTGAASGVGTRLLARRDATTLAMIGAGAQAEWQVRSVVAARPIDRVLVWSRAPEGRKAFAARLGETTGLAVEPAPSAQAAVRAADVICAATTSTEPVFDAGWVRPGTHVNGIGAYRLDMVELPPDLFGSAALVAVDARDAAREEAGDLMAAVGNGLLDDSAVVEIGTIAADYAASRDPDAITVFKSVGLAIQDVAAAECIVGHLLPRDGAPQA